MMLRRFLFLLLSALLVSQVQLQDASPGEEEKVPQDPDFDRNISSLIASRNFQWEEHEVLTKDGYILTVYRIVNPKMKKLGRPVLLQHGLMSTGHDFIINSPGGDLDEDLGEGNIGNNMGFELSKKGYG